MSTCSGRSPVATRIWARTDEVGFTKGITKVAPDPNKGRRANPWVLASEPWYAPGLTTHDVSGSLEA